MTEEESSMREAFQYVRDVYRNCLRILLSADILLEERRFKRYAWDHLYDMDPIENVWRRGKVTNLTESDSLLTGYLFHQYYSEGQVSKDVLTICTAPWRRVAPESFRAVCCATRFIAKNTQNDVYWIGAMPIWEKENVSDGKRHQYNSLSGIISEAYRSKYNENVMDETNVMGISVPLENITSSTDIEDLLIKPLLS